MVDEKYRQTSRTLNAGIKFLSVFIYFFFAHKIQTLGPQA